MSISHAQIFISDTIFNKMNQGFLEKWLIVRLRQKICNMSLVLESKEILKNKSNHNDEICQRDTGAKP